MAEETKTATASKPKVEKKEVKNLKQKLQEARMLLKEENITKSGKNSFTKVGYYTLQDILPPITRVCHKVGMTPLVTFDKEVATLTIYDWDSDETLTATSPMVEQKDTKMNEIQILGSLETYQRRYILQNVFDIVEEDNEVADNLSYHDIMAVKNRMEVLMTDLMKKGYDMSEVVTKCGLKDEKQYMGYLNACGVIDKIEKNMRVLLNDNK